MVSSNSSPHARFQRLIESLFEQLGDAFRDAGWSVKREPPGGPPGYRADFVIERGDLRYVVELRIAREARRPEMPALLADAYVRAQLGAAAHHARPLPIVGAPAISDEWGSVLADYAHRFFRGAAWGLIDGRGRLELHGLGLDGIRRRPRPHSQRSSRSISPPDVFSDRGQWMAKILLAPAIPERFLSAPREPISGPSQLAALGSVSVPSASRFLSRLDKLQFLDRKEGLRLVRREQYLADWRRAARFVGVERPCRWLLPVRDSLEQLVAALQERSPAHGGGRACLGLFAACERLGVGFVRGAPLHLYFEQASDVALEQLGLAPALSGERVDVFVREPMFPESVFRGAVAQDSLLVSDVLQCWLDVVDHPARGAEQAERIWKRVIQPHLLGGRS